MNQNNTQTIGGGGAATGQNGLAILSDTMTDAYTTLSKLSEGLSVFPGLQPAAGAVQQVGNTLLTIGDRVKAVGDAIGTGVQSGGSLGGVLGGLGAVLGPESGNVGEDGEKSFLDKAREKVAALSEIWGRYYDELRDKNGKLNKEKLKHLALEVGETILGSKKMAKVRKALAIAEVIRNRAEAVMTAAKSAPFPANLPAIAFALATGQAQQKIVAQTHAGLDKIPSTGTYFLEKGERVIGRRLNQDLTSFLGSASGDSYTNSVDRSVSRTSTFNPTINLSIGGEASDQAIIANRGAIETMIREIYADYALQAPFGAQ